MPDDPTIKTSVEEADFEIIQQKFREVEVGDEVHIEGHWSTGEKYPDKYTEIDGTVVEKDEIAGMGRAIIQTDTEPGIYKVTDLLNPDYSLLFRHSAENGKSQGRLGDVTVLEVK